MARNTSSVIIFFIYCAFIVALIWLSSVCRGATPTPTPFDINSVDTSTISAEEIAKTIAHRNQLFEEQQKANEDTQQQIQSQAQTLVNAAQSNDQSAKALAAYQAAVAETVSKANLAIAQLDHVVKKLHFAKWLLCGIWIAFVAAIVMQLPLALKQYELIGGGAAIAIGCTFIWLWV